MQGHSYKEAFEQIKEALWLPLVIPLMNLFHDMLSWHLEDLN